MVVWEILFKNQLTMERTFIENRILKLAMNVKVNTQKLCQCCNHHKWYLHFKYMIQLVIREIEYNMLYTTKSINASKSFRKAISYVAYNNRKILQ